MKQTVKNILACAHIAHFMSTAINKYEIGVWKIVSDCAKYIYECNRNYFMRQIFVSIIQHNCLRLKEHWFVRDDSTLSIGFLRHVLVSTMTFSGLRNYSNHARENQLGTWLYATRLPNVNPVFRPCVSKLRLSSRLWNKENPACGEKYNSEIIIKKYIKELFIPLPYFCWKVWKISNSLFAQCMCV